MTGGLSAAETEVGSGSGVEDPTPGAQTPAAQTPAAQTPAGLAPGGSVNAAGDGTIRG